MKKTVIIVAIVILIVTGGIVAWNVVRDNDKEEEEVIEYTHDSAINSAIESGNVDEKVAEIEIGMSKSEVEDILGEEGEYYGASGSTEKYVYSAKSGYRLDVYYSDDDEVKGISVTKLEE